MPSLALTFCAVFAIEQLVISMLVSVAVRYAYIRCGYILLENSDTKVTFLSMVANYALLIWVNILDNWGPMQIIPVPFRILNDTPEK